MYHSGKNPLRKVTRDSEEVHVPRGLKVRRLHKAFLRWHDPENWPLLRQALVRMGRAELIGSGPGCLVPREGADVARGRKRTGGDRRFATQHTGVERAARPAEAGRARPRKKRRG
jgi:hypothetical protein